MLFSPETGKSFRATFWFVFWKFPIAPYTSLNIIQRDGRGRGKPVVGASERVFFVNTTAEREKKKMCN